MPVSGERFAAPEAKPTAGRRERCEGRHGGGADGRRIADRDRFCPGLSVSPVL